MRFDAIAACDGVTQPTQIRGQGRWTADLREQEICRSVVADREDRRAELTDRQAALRHMRAGHRGDDDQVPGTIAHEAGTVVAAGIDAGQDHRREQALEGAAQQEALVRAMREGPAGPGLEHEHAQATAMASLDRSDGGFGDGAGRDDARSHHGRQTDGRGTPGQVGPHHAMGS